jgi:nitrogen fixation protein FixH
VDKEFHLTAAGENWIWVLRTRMVQPKQMVLIIASQKHPEMEVQNKHIQLMKPAN